MKSLQNLVFKAVLSFLFLFVMDLQADRTSPKFDDLKDRFERNEVFSATFIHEFNDTFTGEQQLTEGTIWVGKDRYKIESGNSIMVVDGEISRVYDGTKGRVIISEYEEEDDDFAPSRMLQGVDDSYTVREEPGSEGRTRVHLSTEDPFAMFMNVTIWLNASGVPVRIEAIDQVDNELITYFRNGSFITETEETFRFHPPEGAELIDLRHDS
ncbi:MAG: outer membrane lipoprotein carrier protein LolA [Balneolaceae bacterium]|nr:outer membrane lipoprotein carrier protein LolA [Balneolaceae bacterium]